MKANPIKIKIMITKPEVTDEEIRSSMDFDQVLRLFEAGELRRRKLTHLRRIGLFLTGTIVLTILGYLTVPILRNTADPVIATPPLPLQSSQKKLSSRSSPAVIDNKEVQKQKQSRKPILSPKPASLPPGKPPAIDKVISKSTYTEAEPAEGFAALYEYFSAELKYPAEALKDSVQGVVTVKFVINKFGNPEQIKILNSLSASCDKEAFRLIENMPRWKPATLDGKPVASNISVPLTFQIKIIKSR